MLVYQDALARTLSAPRRMSSMANCLARLLAAPAFYT